MPKNWVRYSTESGGTTIYNSGKGYKVGYRVRSGGAETTTPHGAITGFISVKGGDVVRLSGWDFSAAKTENAINVFNSSFTNIGQFTSQPATYGIFLETAYKPYAYSSVVKESSTVWKWVVPPATSGIAYIRVTGFKTSMTETDAKKMIITINEEIE
jgi:hypothetical protein